jgi:hypothetical protein
LSSQIISEAFALSDTPITTTEDVVQPLNIGAKSDIVAIAMAPEPPLSWLGLAQGCYHLLSLRQPARLAVTQPCRFLSCFRNHLRVRQ